MGVLIHKDASPMYFATGSIMKTRLYAIFHEKTTFLSIAQNNRAKLHHTLQYSSDNKAAMNTGGL